MTSKRKHRLPRRYSEGVIARLDRRYREVRDVRQGTAQILADRGHTADHPPSLLLRRLAQRCAYFDTLLERDEADMLEGKPVNMPRYLAVATAWLRMVQQIGLDRVPGPVLSLRERLLAESGNGKEVTAP